MTSISSRASSSNYHTHTGHFHTPHKHRNAHAYLHHTRSDTRASTSTSVQMQAAFSAELAVSSTLRAPPRAFVLNPTSGRSIVTDRDCTIYASRSRYMNRDMDSIQMRLKAEAKPNRDSVRRHFSNAEMVWYANAKPSHSDIRAVSVPIGSSSAASVSRSSLSSRSSPQLRSPSSRSTQKHRNRDVDADDCWWRESDSSGSDVASLSPAFVGSPTCSASQVLNDTWSLRLLENVHARGDVWPGGKEREKVTIDRMKTTPLSSHYKASEGSMSTLEIDTERCWWGRSSSESEGRSDAKIKHNSNGRRHQHSSKPEDRQWDLSIDLRDPRSGVMPSIGSEEWLSTWRQKKTRMQSGMGLD